MVLDGRVPYYKGKMPCGWQSNYTAQIRSTALCVAFEELVVSSFVFLTHLSFFLFW